MCGADGSTNDVKAFPSQTVDPPLSSPWLSWKDVPSDITEVAAAGPFFLELFSGTARLTSTLQAMGVKCLPPVDIMPSAAVPAPVDVLDVAMWERIMKLISAGAILFIHCGTPCNTFSSARKDDGGPPPLRSMDHPEGLPGLAPDLWDQAFLGNLFVERSAEACSLVVLMGGNFSIENPEFSLIWHTPLMLRLRRESRAWLVSFDQCEWGAPSVKPTSLLVTHAAFESLHRRCTKSHTHVKLRGKVFSSAFGRVVYRTKIAQEYPWRMCEQMALAVQLILEDPFSFLAPSFALVNSSKRKRPLGQQVQWDGHRQAQTARLAMASGYQLKRGAQKPLLDVEVEPGEAIKWVMHIPHPFSSEIDLPPDLELALQQFQQDPVELVQKRFDLLAYWGSQALILLPQTDALLRALPDPHLRRLLRGVPDDLPAQLGKTCHVVLYKAFLQSIRSPDQMLPAALLSGFPIVGPIARSHRWPDYEKPQQSVPVADVLKRAWAIREKIVKRALAVPISENLKKIWDATLEDVAECSCLGPFFDQKLVSQTLGCEDWVPTQRFEVVQKNKVRGCDSATTNLINQATVITEKLQLPSTDSNVAALRKLRAVCPGQDLAGWVLDERKAYRQVPIRPEHRKFSVIVMRDPSSGQAGFFVMVGHSFGLVSAVYNYNRRSAAINEILVSLFGLVAFSFYDDKYGFEPTGSVESAHLVAQCVHWWLGAQFDAKKLQLCRAPVILGVTYNLVDSVLEIKSDRRKDLIDEIDSILSTKILDPGSAGKLKGKLMFGASQLWGKVGRAFLRVISERQYMRFPTSDGFVLDEALSIALLHWKNLISDGPPRPIEVRRVKRSDVVVFTDGFTPDPRDEVRLPDRVGAVLFDPRLAAPLQFSEMIPKDVQRKWSPRKTQIVPVEMVAPILALETFQERLVGADVIILIDSEAVEAALVKGYSRKEDLCSLISVFWDLVFKLQCRVFLDRVSTDSNPSDWPSRDDLLTGSKAGWITVNARWPKALLEVCK